MSLQLDPVVQRKLATFRRRRSRLILSRGLAATVLTFLLLMAVVALIDWYYLLPDTTRWLLSGAAYVGAGVAFWLTSMTRLRRIPGEEEIAAQIEEAEPELRENLRSAVELATDDPRAIHDSPVFRSLLQGKVATHMGRVQVAELLPLKLVARGVALAVLCVVVVSGVLMLGGPRVRQLATRAVLPGANIARVSRIQIDVLAPTPTSFMAATNDTIAVVVDVSGGEVDEVILETTSETSGVVRQSMFGQTASEYAGNISLHDEVVEYRILAGDAVTQRFRIETRPRPEVVQFHKEFDYPDYSQLEDESRVETDGDLVALDGTTVSLELQIDQPVDIAELRIDPADSDEVRVLPLTRSVVSDEAGTESTVWKADLLIREDAVYKVHLVSEETGFENQFSPRYEIRPIPDLIPRAGFVDQQEATLLLPPNEIVALEALAEDDLPLAELEQQVSVNGREWATIPLSTEPLEKGDGRRVSARWQWDLLTHQLKQGDQVTTKLVARDLKGNVGESIPLQVVVAASDFDPKRHEVMERKLALYDDLKAFAEQITESQTSAVEAIERLKKTSDDVEQSQFDRELLIELAQRQREEALQLMTRIEEVARDMPGGADAYDVELVGRVVGRLAQERAPRAASLTRHLKLLDGEDRERRLGEFNQQLAEIKQSFERSASDAERVASNYQTLAAHNVLASMAIDLNTMRRQQEFIVESPTQTWDRYLRHETVVINQFYGFEKLVRQQRSRLPSKLQRSIDSILNWATLQRTTLEETTESEDQLNRLRQVAKATLDQLRSRERADSINGSLPGEIVKARKDLESRAGGVHEPIQNAAELTQSASAVAAKAVESTDSVEGEKHRTAFAIALNELTGEIQPSIEQLRVRRTLTQARPDANATYAGDAGLTLRAVKAQLGEYGETTAVDSEIPGHLKEIAPAYRILEAGHDIALARQAIDALLKQERWNSQKLVARFDHPRQWDLWSNMAERASQRLREAGVDRDVSSKLDSIRWSEASREASRKITERRWRREEHVAAVHDLEEMQSELRELGTRLDPILEEAREIIRKYAPTIPQMARQAADQLRELEETTTEAADRAETATDAPQLSDVEEQRQAVNAQIEDLFDALVEDANQQDVLDEQARERSRDADDSMALIREPAEMMNRALEEASETEPGMQQAEKLAHAAEHQEQTAQALELVAEHFERLDEGLEVAESREQLRQSEEELGLARQTDQKFEQAESLAEMADQGAEELLAELERELQRNPEMQQALSEISENAVREAQNALELAAQDERSIQQANEQSDAEFQQQKKELANELRQLGEEANHLSRYVVEQAEQSAARGQSDEARRELDRAQQALQEAASQASRAHEHNPLEDLAETARKVQESLNEAGEAIAEAKAEAEDAKADDIHPDDRARANEKSSSEKRRQQFRDQQKRLVDSLAKNAETRRKNADRAVQSAERQLKSAENRVRQAEQDLAKKPEDTGRQNRLEQERSRQASEQQKLDFARADAERAKQNADRLKKQASETKSQQRPPLNAKNPAAELAEEYAAEADRVADALAERSDTLAESADFEEELTPRANQLASSEQRQEQVTEDVSQTAEDIARAARHENRLQNAPASEALQKMAQQVADLAQNNTQEAEAQLSEALGEAKNREGTGAKEPKSNQQNGNNRQAVEAQQAVAAAETAIADQASKLDSALSELLEDAGNSDPAGDSEVGAEANLQSLAGGPPEQTGEVSGPAAEATPDQSSPSQQPRGTSSPEEQQRGQQLAQILDQLDRQLAAASADRGESSQPQAAAAETQTSPSSAFAEAARAEQASLALARSEAQAKAVAAIQQGGPESDGTPTDIGTVAEFEVQNVDRTGSEWGKLRDKSNEDASMGKAAGVSEDYRASVEAYFRVLAERARRNK